jgi:hypothetical protein
MLIAFLGIGTEGYPQYQWGGGGHCTLRPLEKAIKIDPHSRLMVYLYLFFFYKGIVQK